jgi:hypothetical protein
MRSAVAIEDVGFLGAQVKDSRNDRARYPAEAFECFVRAVEPWVSVPLGLAGALVEEGSDSLVEIAAKVNGDWEKAWAFRGVEVEKQPEFRALRDAEGGVGHVVVQMNERAHEAGGVVGGPMESEVDAPLGEVM